MVKRFKEQMKLPGARLGVSIAALIFISGVLTKIFTMLLL